MRDCVLVCPVEVYNRFDAGIGVRKAIYKPHAQAVPDLVIKDPEHCIECGLCYDVCGPGSVRREDKEQEIVLDAASIVLTTGVFGLRCREKTAVQPPASSDVVTSLEMERMINASGSDRGENPEDEYRGNPEKRGIHPVRGVPGHDHRQTVLSCVCCMQAIRTRS